MIDHDSLMRRDALERGLVGRLKACDEYEMQLMDSALTRIESRRDARPVIAGLRELRDSAPDIETRIP